MNISVEISMYPLTEDYKKPIDKFLYLLHNTEGLRVETNAMSTQVFGPSEQVFGTIQRGIELVYGSMQQCPFVLKVIKGDVSSNAIKDYQL